MRARGGFTLIELLLVLVLFAVVSGATFRLLTTTQRVSRAQAERTDMQSNMRAGALIVPAELRSIGYDRDVTGTGFPPNTVMPDILGMAADSIAFRAVRSSGIICQILPNTYVIDNGPGGFYTGYRPPVPGRDALMVYGEMTAPSTDDAWFRKNITNAVPGVCHVTYGLRAGTALTVDDFAPGDSITLGAPFHTFEVMSYKLLQGADNRWYLNARSESTPGATYQPMLGPLAPLGFALKYYDVAGNETLVPANVRTIQVTLISESTSRISSAGSSNQQIAVDSVVTRVALRNAMR